MRESGDVRAAHHAIKEDDISLSGSAKSGGFDAFRSTFLPRLCWGFFGLALVRLWIQYYIHSFYFTVDIGELSISSKLFRGALILVLVVILYHTGLSKRAETAWKWVSFVLMTLSGIFFFLQMQAVLDNTVLGTIGAYLGAIGVIWAGGMWLSLFARMRLDEAFLYIVANLGLGSLLGFFFGFLPDVVVASMLLFVPVLIFLGYEQAERKLAARPPDDPSLAVCDRVYDTEPRSTFIVLLVGMALFVFTLGIAQGFPSGGIMSFSFDLQAAHQLSVVAITCALIVWVLILRKGLSFRFLWSVEAILAISSLACYIAPDIVPVAYGTILAMIPITLWLGLSFLLACDISQHTSLPSYLVLGIIYGTYMIMFNLGRMISFFFGSFIEQSLFVIAGMVFMLALSMLLVLREPLPKNRPFFSGLLSGKAPIAQPNTCEISSNLEEPADHIATALHDLAQLRGLTEREEQIALLTAKGRTRKYVSRSLFLSENTVRNHIRNIYQKLDVHTKQEFIDLIESHRDTP